MALDLSDLQSLTTKKPHASVSVTNAALDMSDLESLAKPKTSARTSLPAVIRGMRAIGVLSNAPIHYNTHNEPGTFDVTERETKRLGLTLEQAAELLTSDGYVAAVRRKGQRKITNNHIHAADPNLSPKEAARIRKQLGIKEFKSVTNPYDPSARAGEAMRAMNPKERKGQMEAIDPIFRAIAYPAGKVSEYAGKGTEAIARKLGAKPNSPVANTVRRAGELLPYFIPVAGEVLGASQLPALATADPVTGESVAKQMGEQTLHAFSRQGLKEGSGADILALVAGAGYGGLKGAKALRARKALAAKSAVAPHIEAPVPAAIVDAPVAEPAGVAATLTAPEPVAQSVRPAKTSAPATQAPPNVTAVKNAVTKAQRAKLGLAPIDKRPKTPTDRLMQQAKDLIDTKAVDPDALVTNVVGRPRPLDETETAILHQHLANVERDLTVARANGDESVATLERRFDDATKAATVAGTEQSHAFTARKTATNPYGLEQLLQKGRANVANFDEAKQSQVVTLHQQLMRGEANEAALTSRLRESATKARPVVSKPSEFAKPAWGSENTLVTGAMRQAARERLLARSGRLNAGLDPTVVADLAIEIGYHVEAGARFSYKTLRNYLRKEYGANDAEIAAAYSQVTNDQRLAGAIATQKKLKASLQEGITSKTAPSKAPAIKYNNEWVELHRQNVELRAKLDAVTSPKKPLGAKARDAIRFLPNMPTGILAAWDDSFVGRQGPMVGTQSPKAWAKGTRASLQALKSEPMAWTLDTAIRENPNFALAQRSGLEYTTLEHTAPLASAEESAMLFRAAERIPVVGKMLRPFDRAYTTAANVMRHEAFYRKAEAMGNAWTAEEAKAYASLINKLTGRGDLGRLSTLQPELNAAFISPRKIAADVQLLTAPFSGPKSVRLEAAKSLVRYTAALGTFALLVNASGKGKVSLNPDDADFMKLRVGNTRFDMTGGRATLIRTLWRAGKATWDYSRWGEHKYKQATASDVVLRYLNNKMSPGISAAKSLVTGKDFKGDPITPAQVGANLITPWNAQDVVEAWQTDGAGMGVIAGISGFWGVSAQSYKDKPKNTDTSGFGSGISFDFGSF